MGKEEVEKDEKREVVPGKKEEPMIVYVQRYIKDNGEPGEKIHGPMPVNEWAKYEKENGL